jgi:hypothetical protein
MYRGFRCVHLRERVYLCDISVDGRIILKNKYGTVSALRTFDLGYGQVVGILRYTIPVVVFQ